MTWLAGIRIALRALRVNKLRSILTMLGIIIGVGAVIVMIAIGSGAQAQVEEQIKALGTNLIVVFPGSFTAGGAHRCGRLAPTLTDDDAYALQRELADVEAAAPALRGTGQVIFGGNNWSTAFHGATPEHFEVRNWAIKSGRGFEAADINGAAKVVLLGETVAFNLFGDSDPVGQIVRVRKVPMEVVGVLERKGQSLQGQDQDDTVLMPITTARNRVLGGTGQVAQVNYISVKVARWGRHGARRSRNARAPAPAPQAAGGFARRLSLRNLSEVLGAREEVNAHHDAPARSVAAVSLLVGGIGIMNIMLVSVTERTREIGLRMAVGARADILSQFLVEAVTLALVGGLVGIVLGVGGSFAIGHFAGWRTELQPTAIVLAVGFAAGVGVFFGFYPARKASRLLPIEALRYE